MHGHSAIAAADIERYYDSIDPVKCSSYLLGFVFSRGNVAAFCRLHLHVQVKFSIQQHVINIIKRTCAVLTGTRTSVIAGRPVFHEFAPHVGAKLSQLPFRVAGAVIVLCSFGSSEM